MAELPAGIYTGAIFSCYQPCCGANPSPGPRANSAPAELHSQQSHREEPREFAALNFGWFLQGLLRGASAPRTRVRSMRKLLTQKISILPIFGENQ